MAHAREQECPRGRFLFREGDVPQGIFFIRCGKVKKCKVDRQGREQIIYVAASGELVGYHALLAQEAYPDSAVTLEDSVVVFIPKADFLQVLNTSKVLSQRLLKTLSHEFSVLINHLSVIAQRPVRERLAILLLVLREKYKENF